MNKQAVESKRVSVNKQTLGSKPVSVNKTSISSKPVSVTNQTLLSKPVSANKKIKATPVSRTYHLFKTDFGTCGIAWTADGNTNVFMPEFNEKALKDRVAAVATSGSPEKFSFVLKAVEKLSDYLKGRPADFSDIPIHFVNVPTFHQKVYRTLQTIPAGRVTTYGDLAGLSGSPLASRAVGQAMAKNPLPIIVPCHRVLAASGKIGGFSAYGGIATKARLLELERSKN